jgi:hypothetical protein
MPQQTRLNTSTIWRKITQWLFSGARTCSKSAANFCGESAYGPATRGAQLFVLNFYGSVMMFKAQQFASASSSCFGPAGISSELSWPRLADRAPSG